MRDFIFSTAISEILNHYLILSLDRSVSTVLLIQAKPSVSQASSERSGKYVRLSQMKTLRKFSVGPTLQGILTRITIGVARSGRRP